MSMAQWRNQRAILAMLVVVVFAVAAAKPTKSKKQKGGDKEPLVDDSRIMWRDDLGSALAESASTGRPVFADFTADWCGFCKKLDATTFQDRGFIRYVNQSFIAVKVDVDKDAASKTQYKISGMPTGLVLRNTGEVVDRIVGYMEAESYLAKLREGFAKVGPMEPLVGGEKIKRTFAMANKSLEKQRYSVALALFRKVAADPSGFSEAKDAAKQIEVIEALATEKFTAANKAIEQKQYALAAEALDELLTNFAGASVTSEVRRVKKDLAENPDAQSALADAESKRLYKESLLDIDNQNYGDAMTRLRRIIEVYGDLAVVGEAKKTLDRLRSDEEIVRKAADQAASAQCKTWLSLARTWRKNGRPDRAIEFYQKVIETFPESSFAITAKKEMPPPADP